MLKWYEIMTWLKVGYLYYHILLQLSVITLLSIVNKMIKLNKWHWGWEKSKKLILTGIFKITDY